MKNLNNLKTNVLFSFAGAIIIALSGVAVSAQTFAPAKVATIDSAVFSDQKKGIVRLNNALKALETEFAARLAEINAIGTQIETLTKEVQAAQNSPDRQALQTKLDKIEQLKKDYQRKSEDTKAAYDRRLEQATKPVFADLETALRAYAKKRGIDLVLDLAKLEGVFLVSETVDITTAFIAEYNTKPVTP